MARKIFAGVLLLVLAVAAPFSAPAQEAEYDYSRLDNTPYDPETDPDIDLFIGHYTEHMPERLYGSLVVRDMLTHMPAGADPLEPRTKSEVITYIDRLAFASLEAGASTSPSTLSGEQTVFYIDSGTGVISAGGETAELRNGIGVLMPEGLEFTITNTGDAPLTMYLIVEPTPDGFTPRADMLVKDEHTIPINNTTGHWAHIPVSFFHREDGLATIDSMAPVWFEKMTMGQPHSHNPGFEEVWFSLEGDPFILLGKQMRSFPAGAAYKIPPDYNTPHSTINVTEKPVKVFWFIVRTVSEPPAPSYSKLFPGAYDPETDADIDMFIGDWRHSPPYPTHGGLINRDILTHTDGDPLQPERQGKVLEYVKRFAHVTLLPHRTLPPSVLSDEQEVYYVLEGEGSITGSGETHPLHPGVTVLIPEGVEFSMKNTSSEQLTMYCVTEPTYVGFEPKTSLVCHDERLLPIANTTGHWVNIVKRLIQSGDGLATLRSVLSVRLDPVTFAHPHSHPPEVEEVWAGVEGDMHVLLGKQIRHLNPGAAYLVPADGSTPHANFNVGDRPVKFFYFALRGDRIPGELK